MDGKKIAIGALVALAVLLGGLVAGGLRHDGAAYAQGGVFATYLVTSAEVREGFVNFIILDTDTRRVVFYNIAPPKYALEPTGGRMLERDFQRNP